MKSSPRITLLAGGVGGRQPGHPLAADEGQGFWRGCDHESMDMILHRPSYDIWNPCPQWVDAP